MTLDVPPHDTATWKRLLERVDDYYQDADRSRYLLERSLQLSSRELTERHMAQSAYSRERIERSEERFHSLFDLSPAPTWEEDFQAVAQWLDELRARGVADLDVYMADYPDELATAVGLAKVTAVNPAVADLVRAPDTESLLGPIDPLLVDQENTPAWMAQLKTIWEGKGYLRIDHLVGHRMDGEEFHAILEWHAPRVNGTFDYSRVVVTIIDITERVEAERSLEEVLRSKDEFLASISHELRTPLTSVLGFAEVLRSMDSGTSEDERESLLGIIASEASDLSNIVEDLLVAARAELGQLSVAAVPVDIHAQIAQVVESSGELARSVTVPQRPELRVLGRGDPQRVRQIIRNLLTNADRYGGDNIEVSVSESETQVLVEVSDDGGGLAEGLEDRVFERYYRMAKDDGKPGSVGIGLTISLELAQMMGGNLTYARRGGRTVFALLLLRP